VDDVTHAVRAQRRHELLEVGAVTDLGIEGVVIDHVVAVRAARAGAEVRRAIDVADAEGGQVRNERRRIAEGEARVELQPIGGTGNDEVVPLGGIGAAPRAGAPTGAAHGAGSSSQVTLQGASCSRESGAGSSGWVATMARPGALPCASTRQSRRAEAKVAGAAG